MKTINQINQFTRNNQTIQMYLNIDQNNYRNRSFTFNHGKLGSYRQSVTGTYLYNHATKELNLFLDGKYENSSNTRSIYAHLKFLKYNVYVIARIDFTGVKIRLENLPSFVCPYLMPKSNLEFTEANIMKLVVDYLGKQFFIEGIISNIQTYFNCSKSEVKKHYRRVKREIMDSEYYNTDENKSICRRLRKKYNYHVIEIFETEKLLGLMQGLKKRSRAKISVCDFTYFSDELLHSFDGDIDELEAKYWEEVRENTIYI